ncbi:Vam6/Vps39-like protein [Hypsizygus marmoreus]|uniref:Vam6/Vps39-like protein n=1 Tax=Hypsizygus marmoreus TaxID=39966 RepID=A0A369JTQ2_HYPMA|nr:Vam6/Vps39-like protein [Hypsizygus marmoreus]
MSRGHTRTGYDDVRPFCSSWCTMAPFIYPTPIISSFKERIDAVTVQGDRLYLGTSTGNLHTYSIDDASEGDDSVALVEMKKGLTRRGIEQLGFIKDINSLVVLSEGIVTLFPIPTLAPPTQLVKAKAAFSFAVHTSVQHLEPDAMPEFSSGEDFTKMKLIPTLVTQLLIGCRRKVVIYSWRDGEAQEPKETYLPHSARIISFLNHDTVCFAYSPSDYAIFSIPTMSATDITTPLPVTSSASASAIGALTLTGLTGYMTRAKPKPGAVSISDTEALIAKDSQGIVIGVDGKVALNTMIEWPGPPEELAFVKPYIFTILPPGSVPVHPIDPASTNPQPTAFIPTSVLQISSSISLLPTQTIPFPFIPSTPPTSSSSSTISHPTSHPSPNATIRLLTPSPESKAPLFLVTTPSDRTTATAEGSTVWRVCMKPWAEQVDELVLEERYADALALLDTIDASMLSDKESRRTRIRALNAVAQYRNGEFDAAIDTFLELDFNPAKVVALYPDVVAGRLAIPPEQWIELYGGPAPAPVPHVEGSDSAPSEGEHGVHEGHGKDGDSGGEGEGDDKSGDKSTTALLDSLAAPVGVAETIRERLETGIGAIMRGAAAATHPTAAPTATPTAAPPKESRSPSQGPGKAKRAVPDDLHRSIETLVRYLSDRRPKLGAALESVHITPRNQSHAITPLSSITPTELFQLPNAPLSALTPEQLLRCAQIVDTALYKSYLVIRPSLLGSLCRIPNWCDVEEVEEDLRGRQKFAELIDLYNGKQMHAKALTLLRQLGEKETDVEDKLSPTIQYLQKLGPEHLQQIFESARWIFETDPDTAFLIFTSEDVELPRQEVSDYLADIDPRISARYLEYIIEERNEESTAFHDRLAELYLGMTLMAKKRGDDGTRKEVYAKLLKFIDSNQHYSVDRLYGAISTSDLFEAKAILLGRMGRHDQALELYVYRMHDYLKAEEYCKRIYQPGAPTSNVFLTLLRIYLRPTAAPSSITTADLLAPALDLIARHNPRLDAVETLQLLPPLVTAQDVRGFLVEALRAPIFDTAVVRQVSKARDDQVARRLMLLQKRMVKVTDSRICPQCHKRIGNSVIAVHAPRGEVTHYQCREAFSRKLNEISRR